MVPFLFPFLFFGLLGLVPGSLLSWISPVVSSSDAGPGFSFFFFSFFFFYSGVVAGPMLGPLVPALPVLCCGSSGALV